jgi:hypothetical protein
MATEPPETTQDRNRRVALEVNAMTGTTAEMLAPVT